MDYITMLSKHQLRTFSGLSLILGSRSSYVPSSNGVPIVFQASRNHLSSGHLPTGVQSSQYFVIGSGSWHGIHSFSIG